MTAICFEKSNLNSRMVQRKELVGKILCAAGSADGENIAGDDLRAKPRCKRILKWRIEIHEGA